MYLNPIKSPEEVCESYPTYMELMYQISTLNLYSYEQICRLENKFNDFVCYYVENSGCIVGFGPLPFWKTSKKIFERKKELVMFRDAKARRFYSNEIIMSEEDEVNGYQLYECTGDAVIMDYETFIELHDKCKIKKEEEEEKDLDFEEWFDTHACSDWSKMDKHGTCPSMEQLEDMEASGSAFTFREDNFEALCALPYPKPIIKYSIITGCNSRMESVRYTNFICEWFRRKSSQVLSREEEESL